MPSSSSYEQSVDLALKPSIRGLTLASAMHALALLLLLVAVPDDTGIIVGAALVAASWFWLRRHPALGFGAKSLRHIIWHEDGRWQVDAGDGPVEAELLAGSIVSGPVPMLRFRLTDGGRRSRCLFGDEADASLLRRLRARLSATSPVED